MPQPRTQSILFKTTKSDYFDRYWLSRSRSAKEDHFLMGAVLQIPTYSAPPARAVPEPYRIILNQMRLHAAECRASSRLDLFEACDAISPETQKGEETLIRVVLRVMGQALDKRPLFLKPGTAELSFDEEWLMSLLMAHARGDADSFEFMIRRRVARLKRRSFGSLIASLGFLTENV